MGKRKEDSDGIIALAYLHRYGWIAAMLGIMFLWPERRIPCMGIFSIAFSIWSFIGYKLKWKHIYCSFQNAHHTKMTPHKIRWDQIRKTDAYGMPIVFLVMGLALLLADLLEK